MPVPVPFACSCCISLHIYLWPVPVVCFCCLSPLPYLLPVTVCLFLLPVPFASLSPVPCPCCLSLLSVPVVCPYSLSVVYPCPMSLFPVTNYLPLLPVYRWETAYLCLPVIVFRFCCLASLRFPVACHHFFSLLLVYMACCLFLLFAVSVASPYCLSLLPITIACPRCLFICAIQLVPMSCCCLFLLFAVSGGQTLLPVPVACL